MLQIMLVVASAAVLMLLSDGMADGIIKPMCHRLRPINDPEIRPLLHIVSGIANRNYSFFSAHAANTFALCVFVSLLIRSWWITAAMTAWSLINCWTRIYLGMHFPSDIAAGLLWGAVCGICTYSMYKYFYNKSSAKLHFISSQYTSTGYALQDINLVINIMLLTITYAIIRALLTPGL